MLRVQAVLTEMMFFLFLTPPSVYRMSDDPIIQQVFSRIPFCLFHTPFQPTFSHSFTLSKCPSDARWSCRRALRTGAVTAEEKR